VAATFSWDPHPIPQYGADADADELTGAAEAADTVANPVATSNAATNNPVLRNTSTDSPRIRTAQFHGSITGKTSSGPWRCFPDEKHEKGAARGDPFETVRRSPRRQPPPHFHQPATREAEAR